MHGSFWGYRRYDRGHDESGGFVSPVVHFLDHGNVDGLIDLFCEDAIYTHGERRSEGRDEISELFRKREASGSRTSRHINSGLRLSDIVFLSDKRGDSSQAEGRIDLVDEEPFVESEHYLVLEKPVPTRDSSKIEVVELFAYGCPHCYEFEPVIRKWGGQQASDVDFWYFPAVWNRAMELYARAFYAARELNVAEIIHHPLNG